MKLDTDKIIAEVKDGIGWLTFNQPEKRNAMSLEMWQGTSDVLDAWAADDAVRVIVLKGAGDRAFVSGADISQFEKVRGNAEAGDHYASVANGARQRLRHIEKPLIAMIRGYCLGGGLAVAMAADFRIAADDSIFGIPAGRMGLVYGFEGIKLLTDLVGPGMAKKILFTADRYDAQQALDMGLIEDVVPVADLESYTASMAGRIANNAPLSINGTKRIVGQITGRDGEMDMDMMTRITRAAMDSADYKEGRRAFMEKRQPKFTGR